MAATLITASAQTSAQRRTVATLFTTQSLFSAATIAAFTLTAIVAADLSGRTAWLVCLPLFRCWAGQPRPTRLAC